jgi:hypothetical protein
MPRDTFGMTIEDYLLKRLNQGETDLTILTKEARIQFPSSRAVFSHVRKIRNAWRKSTASRDKDDKTSEPALVSELHR